MSLDRATAGLESVAIHLESRLDRVERNAGGLDWTRVFLESKTAGLESMRDGLESMTVDLESVPDALDSVQIALETGPNHQGKAADDLGRCAESLGSVQTWQNIPHFRADSRRRLPLVCQTLAN